MGKRKPKARRKPRQPAKVNLLRIAILAVIFLIAAAGIIFIWVDAKVISALKRRDLTKRSSVLSAPLRITSASPPSADTMRTYLEERHYRAVTGKLELPGDYSGSGNSFSIFTREYRGPNGELAPARKITIDTERGDIREIEERGDAVRYFTLEPKVISVLGSGDQRVSNYKRLAEIPPVVRNAVIAIEDERFYQHAGVDPLGVVRAMAENIRSMRVVQGGSTLTQQLAKNILFTPEKTFGRKALEALAALSLERHLSKEQILEMYLNEIYLGQEGAFALHGVAEACKAFFGKSIEEISDAEAAMLAGIIKAPSSFSPRRHYKRALERSHVVLDKMKELGYLSDEQYKSAITKPIDVIEELHNKRGAPYFTAALEQELRSEFNIDAAVLGGLTVFTGINSEMQVCAERVAPAALAEIEARYPKLKQRKPALELGLVAIEPHSGLVKAWIGGRDFSVNQFNHVSQAERQIGSTIKPFLYLTALDGRLNQYKAATVTSILSDKPTTVDLEHSKDWTPDNFDHRYRGDVTLRYALENSLNIPAVYVAQKVGIKSVVSTVESFNIASQVLPVPSVALGAVDTNLLRLTAAYAALANGGRYVAPRLYIAALDADQELVAASPIYEAQLADENAVYVLTNILQGVLERGTAKVVRSLGFMRTAAGKTGTSNDTRDAWFIGFTPNLAVGVWVGFDDNSKIGLTGGALAAPIWTKFMQCAAPFHEALDFVKPSNVLFANLDRQTLDLASPECPAESVVTELFVAGTEPQRVCRVHHLSPDTGIQVSPDELYERSPRRRRSFWQQIFG
ncbi:MAG: PBP1A family penicillin-binding protein [Deltaproteobacteria bacterium]|nr:PBP1A family penicillin-binding protein [Deltaproteobacteria bacterium]